MISVRWLHTLGVSGVTVARELRPWSKVASVYSRQFVLRTVTKFQPNRSARNTVIRHGVDSFVCRLGVTSFHLVSCISFEEIDERFIEKIMDLLPGLDSTFWKVGRLQTFEHWPFRSSDNSCNPERMASAGFVAVGGKEEPDLVECFICSKQLDGWDPEDDPWVEHSKHRSQCPFIKLGKPDEASWTVHDLFDLFRRYTVKECTHELEKAKAKVKEESAKAAKEIPQIYKGLRKSYRGQS